MNSNFINNDNSIFEARLRADNLSAEEKLNELKQAGEELAKKIELERQKCESEASGHIDNILSQVDLQADKDYFTDNERSIEGFFQLLESLFNEFEIEVDPGIHQILKEKKEKGWLLSIIKFLANKLKELTKKIFKNDLSFDQRLAKEIEELQAKLESGELSPEEFARVLERLNVLQELKLALQKAVIGWIIAAFAEIFAVNLIAAMKTKEEVRNKKESKEAEKVSLKAKEVFEEAKVKSENKELKLDISRMKRPEIPVLKKEELDLLPNLLKLFEFFMPTQDVERNVETQKPKVEEEKKEEKTKEVVCTPAQEQKLVVQAERTYAKFKADDKKSRREKRDNRSLSRRGSTKESFPTVDHFQVPSENKRFNASAAQQNSVNNAQLTSKCSNVQVKNHMDSTGKAAEPSKR